MLQILQDGKKNNLFSYRARMAPNPVSCCRGLYSEEECAAQKEICTKKYRQEAHQNAENFYVLYYTIRQAGLGPQQKYVVWWYGHSKDDDTAKPSLPHPTYSSILSTPSGVTLTNIGGESRSQKNSKRAWKVPALIAKPFSLNYLPPSLLKLCLQLWKTFIQHAIVNKVKTIVRTTHQPITQNKITCKY